MDKSQWQERIQLIEKALVQELKRKPALEPKLQEAMEYSLTAGGKRLRPILVMAAADAVGAKGTDFVQVACGIEMIHTYSLIHDDLPAMDNDDYRRGKLTNHKVFGEAMAILAGDALLTQAFEVMGRQQGVEPQVLLRVMQEMSIAAGPDGMVGGQVIDMLSEDKRISMEELRKLHMGKTGALFRAALRCGAILGGATEKQLADLTEYAECFGLAFQITDDILDVIGDEAEIGKPVGSDERNNKSTYVTLTSLEEAQALAAKTVDRAVNALSDMGEEAKFLRELVQYLINRKK
ncbi:MAG: farnesyl diphosphate synthase [Anaerovibrio sp.]|nr:polyprenyl synthetase family protein [Selenomonadaceae bacterium]MDD6396987.1 polyprenyl synthetase family protein [Selenomonadaceae bacterium]MDY6053186.1 farnesyl diphosphate synthase [Anaerovibrio sp.]